LTAKDPVKAELVELRYFAGLNAGVAAQRDRLPLGRVRCRRYKP
jgi:hypothetical protein